MSPSCLYINLANGLGLHLVNNMFVYSRNSIPKSTGVQHGFPPFKRELDGILNSKSQHVGDLNQA